MLSSRVLCCLRRQRKPADLKVNGAFTPVDLDLQLLSPSLLFEHYMNRISIKNLSAYVRSVFSFLSVKPIGNRRDVQLTEILLDLLGTIAVILVCWKTLCLQRLLHILIAES